MLRSQKIVFLVLLTLLASGSLSAQSHPKAAWPAYTLAIFPGFGLGHFYCGDPTGALFLAGDAAGLVLFTLGYFQYGHDLIVDVFRGEWKENRYGDRLPSVMVIGLVVTVVSHAFEIADVFRAVSEARDAGKIAEFVPTIDVDVVRASFELGGSLKY